MKSNRVKIISDGTAAGTHVLLADGTDIAKGATRIEVVVDPMDLVRATLTFVDVRLDMAAVVPEADQAENNGRN